ncbi:hypothetical protein [Streptomyces tubercidicus]
MYAPMACFSYAMNSSAQTGDFSFGGSFGTPIANAPPVFRS